MTAEPIPALPDDRPQAARELWDDLLAAASALAPDDWSRPTPCPGWRIHDLLAHCSATQRFFDSSDRASLPEPPPGWTPDADATPFDQWTSAGVAARAHWEPDDVLTELRQAADGHVARLAAVADWTAPADGPLGPTTEAELLRVRFFDLWTHRQDLHLACDEAIDRTDGRAAARTAAAYALERVPWLAARRARLADGARLRLTLGLPLSSDLVVAIDEGRGSWRPPDTETDSGERIMAEPGAFTLLVAGRESAERWRDRGLLTWNGAVAEQFVTNARLF